MEKTGIYYWFGYIIPINDLFRIIKDAGFDNILLWWGDEFAELNGPKEKIAETALKTGLFIENVHLPYDKVNLLWEEDLSSEDLLNHYLHAIDGISAQNIPTAVFHPSDRHPAPPPNMSGLRRIEELVRHAEERKVDLAIENLGHNEHLHYIFRHIESPNLKFCYDSGHANCAGKREDLLALYGDKLAALHLHDNRGKGDEHLIPGEGEINWHETMYKIAKTGYTGSVSLEVSKEYSKSDYGDAAAFLKAAFQAANRLLKGRSSTIFAVKYI
ncbi:MAG: sugar phosphate isomerase/epimerase [Clostridiaceae bacterium]|nr:sugar phosphate isomerase/epimerase [Clostridiaceae bacterium]